jgi:hypothetical protein
VQRLDLVLAGAALILFAGCDEDETDTEPTGDTDTDGGAVPETECRDGEDNDDDGDADCTDSDCASLEACYYMAWSETGTATVTPGADYTGTATWTFSFVEPADGGDICSFDWDVNDVADDLASCTNCDFAFIVELTNGRTSAGDCAAIPEEFGLVDGAGGEGFRYGYGFDADYDYAGTPAPYFMYEYQGEWIAWASTISATTSGSTFDYELVWGYYYYD